MSFTSIAKLLVVKTQAKEVHLYARLQDVVPSDAARLRLRAGIAVAKSNLSEILHTDFREHPFQALG
jgi:hypothetical protein